MGTMVGQNGIVSTTAMLKTSMTGTSEESVSTGMTAVEFFPHPRVKNQKLGAAKTQEAPIASS